VARRHDTLSNCAVPRRSHSSTPARTRMLLAPPLAPPTPWMGSRHSSEKWGTSWVVAHSCSQQGADLSMPCSLVGCWRHCPWQRWFPAVHARPLHGAQT
jgi:hypothetical protein